MNNIIKFVFSCFLIIPFLLSADQSSGDHERHSNSIQQETPAKITNLQGIEFKDREALEALLQKLSKDALEKGEIYAISVPLVGSALLGDSKLYQQLHSTMITLLFDELKSADFKAWLWGRVLLAGYHMQDPAFQEEAYQEMKRLLETSPESAYSAWAYGYKAIYEATIDSPEYNDSVKKGTEIANTIPEAATGDWLWAQVMLLSATSFAQDQEGYEAIVDAILKKTDSQTLLEALTLIDENDWRAWALSIARSAVAKMDPESPFLEQLTEAAQAYAENSESEGSKALSILTLKLSQVV